MQVAKIKPRRIHGLVRRRGGNFTATDPSELLARMPTEKVPKRDRKYK